MGLEVGDRDDSPIISGIQLKGAGGVEHCELQPGCALVSWGAGTFGIWWSQS